jgi:hypothetical protein
MVALGELPFFCVSYALAQMGDAELTVEIARLASLEDRKGIHAIITLGFMKHEKALPSLIEITEHKQEFDNKYRGDFSTAMLTSYAHDILGLYDNEAAESLFLSTLTKDGVAFLLMGYVNFARFPLAYTVSYEVRWYVVKKYGWDKYVNSDESQFVFFFTDISHWDEYCKMICPFMSQDEVDVLREDIKNKIWIELGK